MPHTQPVLPVNTADGHRFELIHIPSDSAGEPLLFLPGMGLSARQYIDFARPLADSGIDVFIHEWRGVGSSNVRAARRSDWGYRELLEVDLAASIAAITERTGHEGLILGGHSLGSQFACMLAALNPDSCRALVLIAGGSPYWRQFGIGMKLVMLSVIAGFPLIATLRGHYPGKRLGFAGREAKGVILDWTRSAWTGRYRPRGIGSDLESAMAEVRAPVLAINMADDWFVPDDSLRWLTRKLQADKVTHMTMEGDEEEKADHYRWMKQPRRIADTVVAWLNEPQRSESRAAASNLA